MTIQAANNNGVATYGGAVVTSSSNLNTDVVRNGTDKPSVSVSLDTR